MGGLELVFEGRSRPDTGEVDFRNALRRDGGFSFRIESGSAARRRRVGGPAALADAATSPAAARAFRSAPAGQRRGAPPLRLRLLNASSCSSWKAEGVRAFFGLRSRRASCAPLSRGGRERARSAGTADPADTPGMAVYERPEPALRSSREERSGGRAPDRRFRRPASARRSMRSQDAEAAGHLAALRLLADALVEGRTRELGYELALGRRASAPRGLRRPEPRRRPQGRRGLHGALEARAPGPPQRRALSAAKEAGQLEGPEQDQRGDRAVRGGVREPHATRGGRAGRATG